MYKYILIFILFFSTANAIEITNVKISGNNRLSNETIKVYGNISIPKNYSNEELNNITKDLYDTNFFKDIDVSVKDKTLFIEVEEYNKLPNKLERRPIQTFYKYSPESWSFLLIMAIMHVEHHHAQQHSGLHGPSQQRWKKLKFHSPGRLEGAM